MYDLRTGELESGFHPWGPVCDSGCQTATNDLVVNDQGDAAVHAIFTGSGLPSSESVVISDPAGVQTVDLVTPASIDSTRLANLQITDQQLSWTDDGTPRSVAIP